jgi:hypothetical protein
MTDPSFVEESSVEGLEDRSAARKRKERKEIVAPFNAVRYLASLLK